MWDGGNRCETYGGTMALMNGAGAKAEDEGLKSPRVDLEVDIACLALRRRPKPRCSGRSGALLFTLSPYVEQAVHVRCEGRVLYSGGLHISRYRHF